MIDAIVMALVIFFFQTPILFLVAQRDKEIKRLNTALLRVEKPAAAAVVASEHVEKTPEEIARDKDLVKERQALWSR